MEHLKMFYKKKLLLGILCILASVILIVFWGIIYDALKNGAPPGSYTDRKNTVALYEIFLVNVFLFVPNSLQFITIILDLVLKRKKTIIVTNTKRVTTDSINSSKKYYIWYVKDKHRILHRFIVYKDVYPLKGKRADNMRNNIYEVTYYMFSKVVTDIKKVRKN